MKTIERKLQEISGSLLLTVPKDWANTFHLKKGSKVKIITASNGLLTISPKPTKQKKSEPAIISYDKYFIRHFFRNYFLAKEKIIIKFKNKEDKPKAYQILKKFMNVQVIEEAEDKITVKCFKIDELSIVECLNRMFYLSLNMIDEIISDNLNLDEINLNLTKFYYMLIMQVRRYIDEGKFTEQNQISLLYALDCRMVAERIKRTSEVMMMFSSPLDTKIDDSLKQIRSHYNKCFLYFYNHEFDKAIKISDVQVKMREELKKLCHYYEKKHDVSKFRQVHYLKNILQNSRSIVMLTR
jgi:phosphate uptake regulator